MSNSPSPELLEVYRLIKAGQRQTAGPLLKTYLTNHPNDADGWWLMAHVVTKPDNVQKCLERVLKLEPNHTKASEKLARLLAVPADEPDDQFFSIHAPTTPKPALTPAAPVQAASSPAATPVFSGPFTTPLPNNDKVTISPTLDTSALIASLPPFDPSAAMEGAPANPFMGAQTPSANGQHPALPKPRGRKVAPPVVDETVPAPQKSASVETVIGVAVIAIALVVLVGMGLFVANHQGWIHLWGMPAMTNLEASSFTLEYPEEWNGICKKEQLGYPVCGVANDARYNHVDWYTGEGVDFVGMFTDAFSFGSFFGFDKPPDLVVTVIAMDVPETSLSYDASSMAKRMYDLTQEWELYSDMEDLEIKYDRREMVVDGRTAYYYRYSMEDKSGGLEAFVMGDQGNMALYDLYIPHDGLMFWMTIQVYTQTNDEKIPDDIIQHMIDTINIS